MSAPVKLSEHFSSNEFACPCCNIFNIDMRLVTQGCEPLRAEVSRYLRKDTPLHISSGYRCAAQNAKEGGGQSSQHLAGLAVDVYCPKGMTLKEFYECALKIPFFANGGVGAYPKGRGQNNDFLHLDGRGKSARWARIDGNYVGIDQAFIKPTKGGK